MTSTNSVPFFWVLYGIVAAVLAAYAYLSRQAPPTAARWAWAAVILGCISWLSLLSHHAAGRDGTLWRLALFAGCELVAIRAGLAALPTRAGRWALFACAWPLVVLAAGWAVHAVRASGIAFDERAF